MLGLRSCVVPVALALVVAAGCKKEPAGEPPNAAALDFSALEPLFAHVPADTPYVLASATTISSGYFEKVQRMYGPLVERALAAQATTDTPDARLLKALGDELAGKWSPQGFASLGIDPTSRSVMYGLDVAPAVARLTLADGKLLRAAVERVAKRAQLTLPPSESLQGREIWRINVHDDIDVLVVLDDKQLVVAIGSRDGLASNLPLITGVERPAQKLDSKVLAQVAAKHQLGSQIVGFADVPRIVRGVLARSDEKLPPACVAGVDKLTANVPLIAVGGGFDEHRSYTTVVVELAPPVVQLAKQLTVAIPGFAAAFASKPAFAFGGGADVRKAQLAGQALFSAIGELGAPCGNEDFVRKMAERQAILSQPLPPVAESLRGGYAVVQNLVVDNPAQIRADGYAVVAAGDPAQLLELAYGLAPPLRQLGIVADGKLHPVKLPEPPPFEVFAGVGGPGIVVAAGAGKAAAESVLAATGGDRAPLLAIALDYGRMFAMAKQFGGNDPELQMLDGMANMFGAGTMSLDVTDHGVALSYNLEIK